jgi:hypothetical protein
MSKDSKSTLHEFLFQLRTPLAGIRGVAALANKAEIIGSPFPPEAHEWLSKWLLKVDIWWKEAVGLTELLGQAENEDQDWKGMIEKLISTLDGVEVASKEAHNIPISETEAPGDLVRMMVHSISHIHDYYKDMQELLPTLS